MTFEHRVLSFCREQGLLERGSRVICAVSGGADSMALVWCLYLLREPLELTISAAHFNHGLRGGESDRDEEHHLLKLELHCNTCNHSFRKITRININLKSRDSKNTKE